MTGPYSIDQSSALSILTATPAEEVKQFVETLLARLPSVEVTNCRTGLAMLPFVDSVKGITFHLGETLLAEATVAVAGQTGYAACLGRDLEQAIAIAILDAVLQNSAEAVSMERPIILEFINRAADAQQKQELELLRKIESTRVELETF
ncbi:MAG: phosphonate C-P lyase system protein PhnG [Caldilineaceae bacterium]